jgi:glutathione S-transferase
VLALYGHPFSSYTWKAQIALHAADLPHDFREVGPAHPANGEFLASHGGPWGKFPVLVDHEAILFEASVIIEHLARAYPAAAGLLPADPKAALPLRSLDRVFDNYVMTPMQGVVNEYLRNAADPNQDRCAEQRGLLERSYAWLEAWLEHWDPSGPVTLVECAAAPSLFYADWVHPIGDAYPRLSAWRASLLARPEVSRCVEAARPFRGYFPLGAPDRD